jgi:hypothetical protein
MTGDEEKLCGTHMSLVLKVAHRWRRTLWWMDFCDVVAEGNVIMVKAVKTFDPKQCKFSTYLWLSLNRHFASLVDRRVREKIEYVEEIEYVGAATEGTQEQEVIFKEGLKRMAAVSEPFVKMLLEGDVDFVKYIRRIRRLCFKNPNNAKFMVRQRHVENYFGVSISKLKQAFYNRANG